MKTDKLVQNHKVIAELFETRIKAFFHTTPAENMLFPLSAMFMSGFICRNYGGTTHYLEIIAVTVMLLSWIFSSLLSGFLKQWYFIFFSAGINLLPYLFFNAALTNPSDINAVFVSITEFTAVYAAEPIISLGIRAFDISLFITGATAVLMLTGFIIRKKARSSREYCKVRLSMLSKGTGN